MIVLIRIEALKLRTTRAVWGLMAAAFGLCALDALLAAVQADSRGGGGFSGIKPVFTALGQTAVLTTTGLAMLMATVLGLTVASGEFRHRTATYTYTYLAFPQRSRVLVAKAVTAFIAGLSFGAAGALAANAVGFGFIAAHGYHVVLAGATIARYDLCALLGAALMAPVGVAVGTLVRSQVVAVVIVLIWGLALEAILAGVFKPAGPYLPYTACMTLASSYPGGGVLGYATESHTAPLPYLAAVGLVAGIAVLIATIAARTSLRRDIT
jgi:ABC-type transport system involved in multi-copper enzyme maturation permease subunit